MNLCPNNHNNMIELNEPDIVYCPTCQRYFQEGENDIQEWSGSPVGSLKQNSVLIKIHPKE